MRSHASGICLTRRYVPTLDSQDWDLSALTDLHAESEWCYLPILLCTCIRPQSCCTARMSNSRTHIKVLRSMGCLHGHDMRQPDKDDERVWSEVPNEGLSRSSDHGGSPSPIYRFIPSAHCQHQYTDVHLYNQLRYYAYLFDSSKAGKSGHYKPFTSFLVPR